MKLSFRNAVLTALFPIATVALAAPVQMGDPNTVASLIDEGKNHSQVMNYLSTLTHKIGPRLTGSPRLTKACNWAMSEFKKMGCTNVHLEKWGDIPAGWDRGSIQVARMVEPFQSDMVFTTNAWTNGTKGLVRGRVVKAPETAEAVLAMKDSLKGCWVLMPPPVPPSPRVSTGVARLAVGPPAAGTPVPQRPRVPVPNPVLEALDKLPIAGIINGSRNELVITAGRYNNVTNENHPGVPHILVRKSDYDRLARNVDFGRNPVVEIDAENRWFKGPVPVSNVVAEIKGTEKPDEVVIVSGHLDSWNGPGSQGALDNGTGTCTCLEAARILTKVGAKPKRTIRFILWTGEEQGLLGSTDYVKKHADELPKISAVLVDDGGTNYQGGYEGIESQSEYMITAYTPVVAAFPTMPEVFRVSATGRMPRGGGSDHAPFNAAGVPGFFTIETGRSDYGFVHHTQHDRYEMAIPEYLIQSATNHAVVAYNLACAPEMLPREPKS